MATAIGTYVTLTNLKTRLALAGTTNDTLLTQIVDETNQWIESYTGRVLAPISSTAYLFDGWAVASPYLIDLGRLGARAVTLLETGSDGVAFTTLDAANYVLRPLVQDRALTGEPASAIWIINGASLPRGYANIRVTMTAGFEAIPDDVRAVAINIAVRAWHGRQSGMADVVGSDETGEPIVTKIIAPEFKRALDRYRPALVA
jgi:hypothetical protein